MKCLVRLTRHWWIPALISQYWLDQEKIDRDLHIKAELFVL